LHELYYIFAVVFLIRNKSGLVKYAAMILSVYIVVLTAMPCNDIHAINSNNIALELSEQNANQTNDVDLCTPFCFCHCCQTLSFPSFYNVVLTILAENPLDNSFIESAYSSPVASIWQPPKI